MKPKEFDELVRQKFDQNDFAYEPRNWETLAEQMDGRGKKRNVIMWWLMPLAGIAASVAMAMGVTFFYPQSENGIRNTRTAAVQSNNVTSNNAEKPATLKNEPVTAMVATTQQYLTLTKTKNSHSPATPGKKNTEETFAISFENAVGFAPASHRKSFVFKEGLIPMKDKSTATAAQDEGYRTFKPEDEEYKKPATTFITLAGGINHGNATSGYMLGGNIRHMVNSKLYIESDVAFTNSSSTQVTEVLAPTAGSSAARQGAGRTTAVAGEKPTTTDAPAPQIEDENQSYTLNYVQISPGLGYKVMNKVSLGVGPDFQQMLGDNRPAPSTVDRNNIAVAPLFDIGMMGKTEYAITKKMKAGVVYRKGINNLLTPMDKYIDRDYLQFQLRCMIFNK